MKPEMNITKKAGASAESTNEKSRPHCSHRLRRVRNPANSLPCPQRGQRPESPVTTVDDSFSDELVTHAPAINPASMTAGKRCAFPSGAPDIDAREQEQPDHVHEVPIPGCELETEVLGWSEMA